MSATAVVSSLKSLLEKTEQLNDKLNNVHPSHEQWVSLSTLVSNLSKVTNELQNKISTALTRRDTGIWKLTGKDYEEIAGEASPLDSPNLADIADGPDQKNGTIEFCGIRVKLVTYKTILGVILINAAKTMSEWMKLHALTYINIIGFDDKDSRTGHWLPTTTSGIEDDPEGQCELYIIKPPLPVSVVAAAAQYSFSIMDAYRMCRDV